MPAGEPDLYSKEVFLFGVMWKLTPSQALAETLFHLGYLVYHLWKRVSGLFLFPWSTRRLLTVFLDLLSLLNDQLFFIVFFLGNSTCWEVFWALGCSSRPRKNKVWRHHKGRKYSLASMEEAVNCSRHLPLGVDRQSRLTVTACLENMEEHLAACRNCADG